MNLPPDLHVLYEDNHLLAVNKPAGLPTMGVAEGKPSLINVVKEYIRTKYNKPGNVYLGTVSRLDAPVTGVLLFARTSKAAARLTEQFRSRSAEKVYWAIVAGHIHPPEGKCVNHLRKDERHRRVHICDAESPGAQEARLSYRTLHALDEPSSADKMQRVRDRNPRLRGEFSLLEVRLETGRKHQIRVQLSHAGHPIVGDRKYKSSEPFPAGIALHARRLVVEHPTQDRDVEINAPLPKAWAKWLPPRLEKELTEA